MSFRQLAAVAAAAAASLVLLPATNARAAGVTISVYAASAPNAYGSASFTPWQDNAVYAIEHGLSSYGTPGTPAYYFQYAPGATLSVLDNVVTGFPSWQGVAPPSGGAAFANEYGNRLTFGLDIKGNGNKISIDQLAFTGTSSDPTGSLDFAYPNGYTYSEAYVGIIYGTGGNPATYVTSGLASQEVDEIVGRGSGNAWDIYDSDPGATQQDKINGVGAKFALGTDPFDFTGTYTLDGVSGSASVTFLTAAVPLPTSASAGLALVAGMLVWRKWSSRERAASTTA